MSSGIRRFLLRLLSFFRSTRAEADLAREISAHLQILEDRLIAQGMTADDARFAARREFGGVEQVKEHQRDARSFRSLDAWWLDVKLGTRMLVKYPGLTLVGGLGLAVAIAIGAASFTVIYTLAYATVPLDEGDRVVGLENWDLKWNDQEPKTFYELATWRVELKSIEDLGAFRTINRTLIVPGGRAEPVLGAEMSASGFRTARVPPFLGRPLLDEDERKGATPVVVIGYDLWRTRFGSDPAVGGRSVQLGRAAYTVVGVMPDGFAFPVNHRLWVPLADPNGFGPREGPEISMFGRLASGATMESAQAELTALGQRASAAFPKTHERLRPRIVPYTALMFDDVTPWGLHSLQFLISMLLVVVGANVAILVYARTATRRGEIIVRSALGASRRRIVSQLFVEALVLALASAAVGLVIANVALRQVDAFFRDVVGGTPFWFDYSLSVGTALYTVGLAVLAAVITGVVPALKATGRRLESGLRQLGGGSGLTLGKTWTAMVVVQVALAVAILPGAVFMASQSIRLARTGPGFPAEEFLTARLSMDAEDPATAPSPESQAEAGDRQYAARYADRLTELVKRLEAEPGVAAVTVTSTEVGNEGTAAVEIEGTQSGHTTAGEARYVFVATDFFDTFDIPVLAGRQFRSGDDDETATAMIVNRAFVEQFLAGASPLGRRISHAVQMRDGGVGTARNRRTYDIVGVVDNFPVNPILPGETEARMYRALALGRTYFARIAIRLRGRDAAEFAGRLREVTAALDPALQLKTVLPLSDFYRQEQMGQHWGALGLGLVTLSVLLLSAAGIYALMSVTVSRRRREIGIRVALGADSHRILRSIFSRAVFQLSIGVVVGVATALVLDSGMDGELMGGQAMQILPAVSVFMMVVGLFAAFGPARRGLRIHPTEALREE